MKHLQLLLAATALLSPSASAQQVMWKDNPITGKVVGLTYGTSGWNAAEAQAVAYGGHLVTVRSQAEQDWLVQQFSSVWSVPHINQPHGPWFGLSDAAQHGNWTYTSGEPVAYTYWYGGEGPSQVPWTQENYALIAFQSQNWAWHDASEYVPLRSLVEVNQCPTRSWSWPANYSTGSYPGYGCTFDMDGDGDLDYASYDRNSGQVSIWRNSASGVFTLAHAVGGCGAVHTTVPLDMDFDGDLDLLAADTNGRLLHLRNDGPAWAAPLILASVPGGYGLTVADVNADGRADVVTTSVGSDDRVRVFLRQVDGSLAAPAVYGPYFDEAYQPTLADLDNDGHLDLLVAGGGVRVLRGSSSGAFMDLGDLGVGVSVRCSAADLNNDGRLEILASRIDADTLEVWTLGGGLTLSVGNYTRTQNLACGDGPHWVETGDVDGDGQLDVVVPSYISDTVHVLRNTPSGLVQDHVLAGQDYALYTAIADFNGDAKPDILTSNHFANAFSVHFNQSIFDCNGNGIDDPLDLNSGFAQDCNGNGRPDSCDLALGVSLDSNGNGFLDECEPTLVAMAPAVRPAFQAGVVTVSTTNIPDGVATLTLSSAGLAAPVVATVSIVNNSGTVTLPALAAASAGDVIAAGTLAFTDALGNTVVTAATSGVFTWDVPEIVAASPANAPFDQSTGVVFELRDHVASTGFGTATFGNSPAQSAYLFSVNGQRWVSTIAPPQAAPGPVSVLLRFGSEQTLAQRGFVYLGPGITSLSATEGWQAGGDALDVGLFGFAPGVPVEVRIGSGQQVASVVATPSGVPAASSISLVTPFVPASGALDLEVVQYAGQPNEKRASSPGAWLSKPPAILAVQPATAFQSGGEPVTLTLEGFPAGAATRIELGTQVFSTTNVGTIAQSSAQLVTSLAPQPGVFDLHVRQAFGQPTQLDASLAAAFTLEAPSLASVLPASGPREGGTVVVVQARGFDARQTAQVQVGGTTLVGTVSGAAASQTVTFRTTLATASGPSDVTISQGVLVATLPAAFTFDPPRVQNYCQSKVTSAGTTPLIGFTGSPSASTGDFAITLSNALPDKYCLYFYGTAPTNLSFNGGKLCVAGNIKRGPTVLTNASSFVSCPFPVTPALVGQNRYFQWWFRDPADPFSVGLTGGLRVLGFYP